MGLLSDVTPEQWSALGLLGVSGMRGDWAGGLLAANQSLSEAKGRALKEQLLQAQIAENVAQTDERRTKIAEAQRQAAVMQQVPSLFRPGGMSGGEAVPQTVGGEPMFSRPLQAAPMRQEPGGFDVQGALRLGLKPEQIAAYAGLQNLGRPEVARVEETMQGGRPVKRQLDKYGQPVGDALEQWKAPIMQDLGGRVAALDPVSLQPRGQFGKTMTPGEQASNSVAWANHGVSQQRLAHDQRQTMQPQLVDGQWVYKPTMNNPQGATTPVAGFQKPLGEGAKKQVTGIDSLNSAIDDYVKELDSFGTLGVLNPQARAKMGTKYNNMMLQAKEAYNLGVLNGPDYQILTSVIADPTTAKGAFLTNETMKTQASELQRLMGKTRAAVTGQGGNQPNQQRTVTRTGTLNGRKVVQYSDGTTDYAN